MSSAAQKHTPAVIFSKVFSAAGDFAASNAAERFLSDIGFSVGRTERGSPRGILFGDYDIAKWHNLSRSEREALHGVLTGDGRNGPITVTFYDTCPVAGHTAIAKAEGRS